MKPTSADILEMEHAIGYSGKVKLSKSLDSTKCHTPS
jgi:hypothetical protein